MTKKDVVNLLAAHANALNDGTDIAAPLLTRYAEQAAEVAPLFELAASLKTVLVPVSVPAAFRARLRRDLSSYSPIETTLGATLSRQRVLWLGVAAAGSVLSVAGLVLLVLRRLRPRTRAISSAAQAG